MSFILEAACVSHRGKVRRNNEDNFYFGGKCMEEIHEDLKHPACLQVPLVDREFLAVFDGIGGENFGERASFEASREVQEELQNQRYLAPEREILHRLVNQMNDAVVAAQKELLTSYMGTTLVSLYFTPQNVYTCNLGDSRAYRLRYREFMQLSRDHVDSRPLKPGRKPAITQYLGIDPEEMLLCPYIAMGELEPGDQYLLCSDGLTDMVSNFDIADILLRSPDCASAAESLLQAALDAGGKDNVTIIVCRVEGI